MNKDIKQKWVNALRSGKYKQGKGALCKNNYEGFQFCCLGVLCDLHSGETDNHFRKYDNEFRYLGYGGMLPAEVQEWAGLLACDPTLPLQANNNDLYPLSQINDDHGYDFSQIADLIEAQL